VGWPLRLNRIALAYLRVAGAPYNDTTKIAYQETRPNGRNEFVKPSPCTLLLHRGARNVSKRTENAAMPLFGFQELMAG
jgi:hypothetical protein